MTVLAVIVVVIVAVVGMPGGREDLAEEAARSLSDQGREEEQRQEHEGDLVDHASAVTLGGGPQGAFDVGVLDLSVRVIMVVPVVVVVVSVELLLRGDLAIEVRLDGGEHRVHRVAESDRADRHRRREGSRPG